MKPLLLLLLLAPATAKAQLPPLELARFAPVPPPVAIPDDATAQPVEPARPALADAANAERLLAHLGLALTREQRAALARDLLVVLEMGGTRLDTVYQPPPEPTAGDREPHDWRSTEDEMLSAFARIGDASGDPAARDDGQAKLVTPDLFLHAWHRFFSNALEVVEQRQLRPRLDRFLLDALAAAAELRASAPAACHPGLDRLRAQLGCAWVLAGTDEPPAPAAADDDDAYEPDEETRKAMEKLLPPPDPRPLPARLEHVASRLPEALAAALRDEVELVRGARGMAPSPLFSGYGPPPDAADYSQFIVRSHYTKTPELRAWFRAMMFLGRNGIPLPGNDDHGLSDTLLLVQLLAHQPQGASAPPLARWREIMEITAFFAGTPDDLCWPELRNWLAAAGHASPTPADAVDPAFLARLKPALKSLRQPQVVSSIHLADTSPSADPPSFRVFGQRFTWDAWVLSELTRGSPQQAPTMVTGAYVAAAFGDPLARQLAAAHVAGNPVHERELATRLDRLGQRLGEVPDAAWFGSMAAKQLHVLTRLAGPPRPWQPAFMQTPAHAARRLEAMLGSWTELKHDTVLYAKQSYAEAGEGGAPASEPPIPRGFVEPHPAFWAEFDRLATFAADGFARHRLLPDAAEEWSILQQFARDVLFCRTLAARIAAGRPLSADQNRRLWALDLRYMDTPLADSLAPDPNRGMTALVTDVHTDANSRQVLLEALGKPVLVLALVNHAGDTRLTAGVGYRHFEFTAPMDARMTDEQWRAKVYQKRAALPPRAAWAAPILAPLPAVPAAE